MNNEFLQNLMANNIQVLEDFYKKDKLSTFNEDEEYDENNKNKKNNNNQSVVIDWVSLNNKENEKFLKIEARIQQMKNKSSDSDDDDEEYYDSDSSNDSDEYDSDENEQEETKSLEEEDDDDDENEQKLTEKEKIEIHDKKLDKQENEKVEKEFKYEVLSKFYCYRILIELVRELKNIEDKISSKEDANQEEYVYRKYEHDDVDDKNSFAYLMTSNQIALKTKLDNESYISILMFCFELVFDDKSDKLNDIRQHIIESLTDFDNSYISRIKYIKTLSVQNWYTLIEDSLAIPYGDFVKFEFNFDKSKIIEKIRYEFDNNITQESVENIRFYTILDIMNMYEQKIFENRILAKYN